MSAKDARRVEAVFLSDLSTAHSIHVTIAMPLHRICSDKFILSRLLYLSPDWRGQMLLCDFPLCFAYKSYA
jgi:hypothetical protein